MATAEDFGRELSLAREHAGLTVREVARSTAIPVSTVGDYFAGRHLPSPAQAGALRKILGCCGRDDPAEISAWIDALLRARRAPGRRRADAPPPYPGLAAFQPEDSAWFFGRYELTQLLQAAAAAYAPPIPLIVIGPSGSGKSSLLRAGLMPRLTESSPTRPVLLFTPGSAPRAALAAQLAQVPADATPALIVDQFEEIFAVCPDEEERRGFITALSGLSRRALGVLGMRADFCAHAIRYPELARSLQERQVVVSPMTQEQLLAAIVEPARRAKLTLEPGLAELVLRDLAPVGSRTGPGAPGHEAGALPFLSHALRMTWERSRGGRLTVAGYQASGGIWDAIGQTAEAAYSALGAADRAAARQ